MPTIDLTVRRSRALRAALVALALAATAAVLASELPGAWLLAVPLLLAPAWRAASRHVGARLRLGGDGSVLWQPAGAEARRAGIEMDARGPLLLLTVRADGSRSPSRLALPPDTLSADERRRLRLWRARQSARGASPVAGDRA